MSLVLICTSVLLCVCMWVGGWLNVPVEFLFQNRISSRKRVYNARNVTTSIVIINLLKLIINSISALQVHCAEIWSFCHVKKRKGKEKNLTFTLIRCSQGQNPWSKVFNSSLICLPFVPLLHYLLP